MYLIKRSPLFFSIVVALAMTLILLPICFHYVSAATPKETPTPAPTETPAPEETFTPAPTETLTPEETSTPAPTETLTPEETTTPAPTETPAPEETSTPAPTETPAPEEMPIPAPTETPADSDDDSCLEVTFFIITLLLIITAFIIMYLKIKQTHKEIALLRMSLDAFRKSITLRNKGDR